MSRSKNESNQVPATTCADRLVLPWARGTRISDWWQVVGWSLLGAAWSYVLIGMAVGYFERGNAVTGTAVAVLGAPGLFLMYRAVAQAVNRTVIDLERNDVRVRQGPLPLGRRTRRVAVHSNGFDVREREHRVRSTTWRTYDVVPADALVPGQTVVHGLRNRSDAERVVRWLEDAVPRAEPPR